MYRCDNCHSVTAPGERQYRIPRAKRQVVYPSRDYYVGENKIHDPGGVGHEMTGELVLCDGCYQSHEARNSPFRKLLEVQLERGAK